MASVRRDIHQKKDGKVSKMTFTQATREKVPIKILLQGPSNSGKTLSALRLAHGIAEGKRPIFVIDSENRRASSYAETEFGGHFQVLNLTDPFTHDKYIKAIQEAEQSGLNPILIVDSLTHEWAGSGGMLAKKDEIDARGGNTYANWRFISGKHQHFVDAILHSPLDIICTVRAKQDYVLDDKNVPVKVGLAPIQREGLEYEFLISWMILSDHSVKVSKDNTGIFDGTGGMLTEEIGKLILEWRNSAPAEAPVLKRSIDEMITQLKAELFENENIANDWIRTSIEPPITKTKVYKALTLKKIAEDSSNDS